MTQNNIYLASKPRYEILDGLRGVATKCRVAQEPRVTATTRVV